MLPKGHISLLLTTQSGADEWKRGLAKVGVSAQVVEATGSDAAKGDFHVTVAATDRKRAQAFMSSVLAGELSLPRSAPVRGPLLWGAVAIVVAIFAFLVAALLGR